MFTIRKIAQAIVTSELEAMNEDARQEYLNKVDKALRNLSQRVYLPPKERKGRADMYTEETACALRLIQKLFDTGFSVSRPTLEAFARWMQQPNGDPRSMVVGSKRLVPIAEAINRAKNGEDFNFEIFSNEHSGFEHRATWEVPGTERGKRAYDSAVAAGLAPELTKVWLSVPASALIRDFLQKLNA